MYFVPKDLNPSNAPKLRPIEDFWGIYKQIMYGKRWRAKNIEHLKKKIAESLKKFDLKVAPQLADCLYKSR